ncbi:hypothetical protein EJF36_18200 [Bacillus sp. HMF5848]|uniref:S-layer homology domain-containing protein n=1 Tax=Bacillus sp. HMF5848 TaxID=2495421 RepID=UPI000F795C20|nr:S-layer homology domain-containing protein [Bacillus sp. HMF5848]RSK28641.1 hypothetical protein EJF36_18200 [Bacillus sp. HMF5848]
MKRQIKGLAAATVLFSQLVLPANIGFAAKEVVDAYAVSPGVTYINERLVEQDKKQEIRVLEVDLDNPFAEVELGYNNPLTSLMPTTKFAEMNTRPNHHVVGAINGSFYHMTSSKLPAYLVAYNNKLLNLGVISTGLDEYMSIPTAFGMLEDGTPKIDTFQYKAKMAIDNSEWNITSFNKQRGTAEIIAYTPQYSFTSTRTNQYGMEVVIQNLSKPLDANFEFGETVTGTITKIAPYGIGNSEIPKDGLVISIAGGVLAEQFKDIALGDEVELNIDLEDKWKNAEFMLASGPILVKDGKVDLYINKDSKRAKERHPRTAVAIDYDQNKVFFVTVDGRQKDYSDGMGLEEFAKYLVSLGVDSALNLDGGGSTTMAIRQYGDTNATVVNSPSGGFQRSVSTILQAVSTAPYGQPRYLNVKEPKAKILTGTTVDFAFDYVLDEYMNPLKYEKEKLSFIYDSNVGIVDNMRFTAKQAGKHQIVAAYEGASQQLFVDVVDSIPNIKVSPTSIVIGKESTTKLQVQAFDEEGNKILFDPALVKWSLEGDIGTVDQTGTFVTGTENAEGTIQVTLAGKTITIPVIVDTKPILIDGLDIADNWEVEGIRATGNVAMAQEDEPFREGDSSLKLNYDFTGEEPGTTAVYMNAKNPIELLGYPKQLGMWVYSEGSKHWLRAKILAGDGKEHTVNLTADNGLNWKGWRFVRADIPEGLPMPLKLKQIYVAEPVEEEQTKTSLYFDKMTAIYDKSYVEQQFLDVPTGDWAEQGIIALRDRGIITGYDNGEFKPNAKLSRMHAAVMMVRALGLNTKDLPEPGFTDVPTDHPYYNAIKAVAAAGIMTGKDDGSFDLTGSLTRGQMAAILYRAYNLTGEAETDFADIPKDHWFYKEISALKASGITTGYEEDNTYRANNPVTRAQYSMFLYRTLNQ